MERCVLGINGTNASFPDFSACVTQQSSLSLSEPQHLGVCLRAFASETRCAVAQLGDGLVSVSVWGDTARPSEAEGRKKEGA